MQPMALIKRSKNRFCVFMSDLFEVISVRSFSYKNNNDYDSITHICSLFVKTDCFLWMNIKNPRNTVSRGDFSYREVLYITC